MSDSLDDNFSPISEAYSSIRASLDFVLPPGASHVFMVTSSQSVEGKTTSATLLARKYAELGRKVLLIDADLRRPAVARALGVERGDSGLIDVLHGRMPLASALAKGTQENLDFLPPGRIPEDPVQILSSGLLAEFIKRARASYDLVIFDSAPVMGIADAPLLSRFVDGVVFVVEANRANVGQTRTAIRRLRDSQANILGVILTKYRALEAGDQYSYQYRYYTYSADKT